MANKRKEKIAAFAALVLLLTFTPVSARSGDPPSGRIDYAIQYYPPLKAFIMHGGWGQASSWQPMNEMWRLDAGGWAKMSVAASPSMAHHSMTYDSNRQVLVLCGRKNLLSQTDLTYETWEFDGAAWSKKADIPTGIGGGDVEIAYDPLRRVTVLYAAGFSADSTETWEFNGGTNTWAMKNPSKQPMAVPDGASMTFHETDGKVTLIVGKYDTASHADMDETWQWDGTEWAQISGTQPTHALGGSMAFDSRRGEMVLLTTKMETWILTIAGWSKKTPASIPSYTQNSFFTMAYSPSWRTSLFFGGEVSIPGAGMAYPDKTWQWNGSTWSEWSVPIIMGDINGDGMINLADAILALQATTSLPPPADTVFKIAADVNSDGKIGLPEAVFIMQNQAGLRMD